MCVCVCVHIQWSVKPMTLWIHDVFVYIMYQEIVSWSGKQFGSVKSTEGSGISQTGSVLETKSGSYGPWACTKLKLHFLYNRDDNSYLREFQKMKASNNVPSCLSHVWLFETPWTAACQAPLSLGFSRQEYWGVFPGPPPGDLPHPGIKPESLMSPALADGFFTTSATWGASKRMFIFWASVPLCPPFHHLEK